MKRILFSVSFILSLAVNAQVKSGIIKYEMVTSLAVAASNADKQIPESILAMFPKEMKNNKQLRFNETASIYENVITAKSNEEEEPQESNGMTFRIKTSGSGDGPKEKIYLDLSKNQKVESKSFFGKDFLILSDSAANFQWKPTGKQKLILSYPCYEAITMGEVRGKKDTITAWYTPQIVPKAGPMGFCNLPGMILQLQLGNITSITATEVIEQEMKDTDIEKPNEGKKVTAAEFKEITDKKMKEMGIERGKPRVIIRNSNDMQ